MSTAGELAQEGVFTYQLQNSREAMLTQLKLQLKIKTNPLWDEMEMSAQG